MKFPLSRRTKGQTMKFTTMALASVFALGSTFALAQVGGAGPDAPRRSSGTVVKDGYGSNGAPTTDGSMSSSRSSGSEITTGSGAPQDKPNISGSSETSDTSRKVK